MERLRKLSAGKRALTLLELLIAITLLTVVLLTAASLLITFKKFYSDFIERQSDVGEVSLGILEEIANRIKVASDVSITRNIPTVEAGSKIDIRVDNVEGYIGPVWYSYWKAGSSIKYRYQIEGNPPSPVTDVAQHIGSLLFQIREWEVGGGYGYREYPAYNQVKINIDVIPSGGAQQHFETTVTARARSAQPR